MTALTLLLAALVGAEAGAPRGARAVLVNIRWEYQGLPPSMRIHEVKGRPRLWDTRSVSVPDSAPLGKPIDASTLSLRPGGTRRFALVYRNSSDSVRYFFAAPHLVHPAEHSLGFKFKCLCINHAFKAAPGETWYRVVEFRLAKEFVGDSIDVTHTLIGITAERAAAFSKEPVDPDP